jgi:putative ABC transport system permease protein
MINLLEIYRLVVKNMLEKKKRVFLTISGIIIGIFTFVFFIFVSQGLSNAISEQFTSFGVNVIGIQGANGGGGPGAEAVITDTEIAKVKQVARNYKYVSPLKFYQGQYEFGREKQVVTTIAYGPEYMDDINEDLGIEMLSGRVMRPTDRGSIVLGYKTAFDTFEREIAVGSSLKVEDKTFRVIGIVKERGDLFVDNSIVMHLEDMKELSGNDKYTGIRVSLLEGADMQANKDAIDRRLNPNGKQKNFRITSPEQTLEQVNQILGLLTGIISFISSVALIVGGINIMNTMYSNVLERINEISVMKALGGTNEDIRNLYLFESGLLGLVGSFIGFALAYGFSELVSYLITNFAGYNVPVYFNFTFFLTVLIITTILSMLFGTYPALRAAHVNPADNLRDE